jgi:hypothetical protein
VQRIDARFWTDDNGYSRMGICVSLAAGLVRCDGAATIEGVIVRRAALGPPQLGTIECDEQISYRGVPVVDASLQDLQKEVGSRRDDLEVEVALKARPCQLMVVDGHIRRREEVANAVGVLKTHQARYLEPAQERIVGQLGAGERTPVFFMQTERWNGYSWYLRLPGGQGHAWAGIVRCEANSDTPAEAVRLANLTAATLPRFASNAYKDTRAPQNLYPVGGLERDLRRRLGDQLWLLRSLQRASHHST